MDNPLEVIEVAGGKIIVMHRGIEDGHHFKIDVSKREAYLWGFYPGEVVRDEYLKYHPISANFYDNGVDAFRDVNVKKTLLVERAVKFLKFFAERRVSPRALWYRGKEVAESLGDVLLMYISKLKGPTAVLEGLVRDNKNGMLYVVRLDFRISQKDADNKIKLKGFTKKNL